MEALRAASAAVLPGVAGGAGAGPSAAQDDAPLEGVGSVLELIEALDLPAAAGVAADGHVLRVAAEGRDVVMYPVHSHHQVRDAHVAGVPELLAVVLQIEVGDDVQPVVDGHEDHVPVVSHAEAVEGDLLEGVAAEEAAAVDPDEHGLLLPRGALGGPDVQVLAVLALLFQHMEAPIVEEGVGLQHLHGHGTVLVSVLDAGPGLDLLRHMEALCPGIVDAHEDVHVAVGHAPELPLFGLHDGPLVFKYELVHTVLLHNVHIL